MTEENKRLSTELVERLFQDSVSRRSFLKRTAALGLSVPIVGGLLAACGGDDDDDDGGGADDPTATTADSGSGDDATATTADSGTGDDPTATSDAGGAQGGGDGKSGGTMNFGLLRDAIGFDPHISYGASSSSLQGNVYDQIITYDLDGNLIGGLAESWEVSDDGLEYILTLRQGVVFHEGQDFTSADIVANLDRIRDEANSLARRTELANIDSYAATDDFSVTLTLASPYATLLAVLATNEVGIASKEWLDVRCRPGSRDERYRPLHARLLRARSPLHAGKESELLG